VVEGDFVAVLLDDVDDDVVGEQSVSMVRRCRWTPGVASSTLIQLVPGLALT